MAAAEEEYRHALQDIEDARMDHSWQAVAALRRIAMEARSTYHALMEREKEAKAATQDVSARLDAFRDELRGLPRAMRLRIRAIVLEEVGEDA